MNRKRLCSEFADIGRNENVSRVKCRQPGSKLRTSGIERCCIGEEVCMGLLQIVVRSYGIPISSRESYIDCRFSPERELGTIMAWDSMLRCLQDREES